jgi:plasmid stability protein
MLSGALQVGTIFFWDALRISKRSCDKMRRFLRMMTFDESRRGLSIMLDCAIPCCRRPSWRTAKGQDGANLCHLRLGRVCAILTRLFAPAALVAYTNHVNEPGQAVASLTIDLPEQQRAALAAKARAKGLSTEDYAREVLEHDLTPEWLQTSWTTAKEAGLDQLSREEIDAEIAAARKARRESRTQPGS